MIVTLGALVIEDILGQRCMSGGVYDKIREADDTQTGPVFRISIDNAERDELAADADYQGWGMDWPVSATYAYRSLYHQLRRKGAPRPNLPCCPADREKVTP